jgi:hypothetical protein
MKMAAQSEGQLATGGTGVKTTSTMTPGIICGIGAVVTLAIVTAVTFNSSPRTPDPTVISTVQQAAETSIAPPASPPSAPIAIVSSNPVQQQTPSYAFNVPQAPALAPDQRPAPSYAPAPDRSQQESQCFVLQRKFYFVGRGVIRVRAGGFVSAPISLDANPQEVVLPSLRPVTGPGVKETIFIDGNAGLVVMTSDLPGFRQAWNNLHETATFYATWKPMRKC